MRFGFKRNLWIVILLIEALILRGAFEIALRYLKLDYSFTEFVIQAYRFLISFFAILIWVRIAAKAEYSISKLPWLIILTIEPITGTVFFLSFGRDFRESQRHNKHPLTHNGKYLVYEPMTDFEDEKYRKIDSEVTDIFKTAYNMTHHHAYLNDSECHILKNGDEFFPKLIEKLENAEKFIFMQFYIIRTDRTGKRVLDILKQKAEEGVEVKLLYDAIGSAFLKRKYMASLVEAGVQIDIIDPVQLILFDTRVNYRNHRKQTIIDGEYGFIGGMNLADEYWYKTKKLPEFRDTQVMLRGKVVNSLTSLFVRDWYYVTNTFLDDEKYYCSKEITAISLVQIIPSGPDFKYPPIRNTYVKMINNAKKSIKVMTPYLALDQELVTSLIIAARGGVDVEIIVPGEPDKKSVYEVTKSFFEELLEEDIKIYTYTKKFTHAKILIMDDIIASCGTYNLDNRSARINFEATVLMYQTGVELLVSDFDLDRSKAKLVDAKKWRKRNLVQRLYSGLIGLFAPLV